MNNISMNNRDIFADKLDFSYKKEENQSDVRNFVALCVNYWYLFAIAIAVSLVVAFFYIQHLPSQWIISSKIIVEDDKNSPGRSLTNGVNADLASLFEIKSNADNEVKVIKSRSLLKSVINDLNLNTHIYSDGFFRKKELYADAPFTITADRKDSSRQHKYSIVILNYNQFTIEDDKTSVKATGTFGQPVKMNELNITLNKTAAFQPSGKFSAVIMPVKTAERQLDADFNALLDDKQATVIDLQLSYEDPERGEQILRKLMDIYLQNNLANKVRLADSTMKFIDKRLVVVGSQLDNTEKDLERYKVQNNISDIGAQSKALVQGADEYQNKLNENDVQLNVVNSLYKSVSGGNQPQVIPSSLVTKDPAFGSAINEYNAMLLRREQLKMQYVEKSPVIENLDQQIDVARKALLTSLHSYRNSLEISQGELRRQNATISQKISSAPVKERGYLDYARQQTLKQDLYLFLLQKREETAISQTATISNCRVLDDAESEEKPYAPKKSLIYIIGLFAGILVPITGISIREMLNIKIQNKSDVEKHTAVPLLGEISRSENKKKLLVYTDPLSLISEEIRAVRTNLKYITDKGKSNVIMFTSSMSGEGKSFISLNLANSIAISGKKVVLLELDLRKPKLLKSIGIDNEYGFTNYMISSDKNGLDKLVKQSSLNENFYIVSSGPIPPNPAEMLMDDKLRTLIAELRDKFDYVIIDTAPVGLVSDALIIEEFADITCYVLRQNYTYKSQLGIVNDLYKTKKVKQLYLIVNDIQMQKNAMTGYGHGYGHGYGNYQYDMTNAEHNMLSSLLKKVRSN